MSTPAKLKAPFPWFGGKSRVADIVWQRFGNPANYVEPFFGSGAVLLARPHEPNIETINDKDGLVANFWRALQADPAAVAKFADNPVNENDLHARHIWLVSQLADLNCRLEGNPEYFDPKVAGYWCWGICCWIGGEFCSGKGPWKLVDGKLVISSAEENGVSRRMPQVRGNKGVNRKLPHLGDAGQGIQRKRQHLGHAGKGVIRQHPQLNGSSGGGVNKKRPLLSGWADKGVNAAEDLDTWFADLAARLRRVRVCCGDWSRITGPSVTVHNGLTGVFLDPPYSSEASRDMGLYRSDCGEVAHAVREWCLANGEDKNLRIALCGYEGEHAMPASWECLPWKASGGYAARNADNKNNLRERIWFSPHCLKPEGDLFGV